MYLCFYNALGDCLFEKEFSSSTRIPIKGDYIDLKKYASSITTNTEIYNKYKQLLPVEIIAIVLKESYTEIYVDLNKELKLKASR